MTMPGADVSSAVSAPVRADLVVQGPYVLREDLDVLQLLTGADGVEPLDARAMRRLPFARARRCCRRRAGVRRSRLRLGARARAEDACARAPGRDGHGFDADHDRVHRRDRRRCAASATTSRRSPRRRCAARSISARASTRRVALLAGLPVTALAARLRRAAAPVARRAANCSTTCARIGAKTLLVSGGFTFFTDRLQVAARARSRTRQRARDRRRQAHGPRRRRHRRRGREGDACSRTSPIATAAMTASPSRSATARTTCRCSRAPTSRSRIARSRACARRRCTRSITAASTRSSICSAERPDHLHNV